MSLPDQDISFLEDEQPAQSYTQKTEEDNGIRFSNPVVKRRVRPAQQEKTEPRFPLEITAPKPSRESRAAATAGKVFSVQAVSIRSRIHLYSDHQLWLVLRQPCYILATEPTVIYHPDHAYIRKSLFHRYLMDISQVVRTYCIRRLPPLALVQPCDLLQSVSTRAWDAMNQYDPTFGTTFMQYCNAPGRSILYGAIIDELRRMQDYPRFIAKYRRELQPIVEKMKHALHRDPTIDEICQYGNQHVDPMFESEHRPILEDPLFHSGVFNQREDHGDGEAGEDAVAGEMDNVLHSTSSAFQNRGNVNATCHAVDQRDAKFGVLSKISDMQARNAVRFYYWDGMIDSEIGSILGVTQSKAAALRMSGVNALRAYYTYDQLREILR